MSEEYRRQYAWRPWPRIFAALPEVRGLTILDLGCNVGDQAAELSARGAHVIGIDSNEEFIATAKARGIDNAEFVCADISTIDRGADAIWCSFAAAYFPAFAETLRSWRKLLSPGGWIAVTEIDDLFGHEPLSARARELFRGYAVDALNAGRYDFHMGHKLETHLQDAGFAVANVLVCEDAELAFDGPAPAEVIDAWRARFARMGLLREFCGPEYETVRDGFLACLSSPAHRSAAKVYCAIGVP